MKADTELIQSLLDGTLSDEDRAALNERLRTDPTARADFAQQMKLHALLQWRTGSVVVDTPKVPRRVVYRQSWQWAGWAAAAALVLGFTFFMLTPNPAAAAISQIITAWGQALDRSYTITVLEGDAWQPLKDGRQVNYEGARLHLRGGNQFVLERMLDRGGEVITGSDGTSNWDIRGKGPVRVSTDVSRFRGAIPGEYQSVPFLDLSSLLGSLTADYDITLRESDSDPALQQLIAHKRHREKRGLPRMEFMFRQATGTIVSMTLHGLPEEKGGPRAVQLTLTSEAAFSADFFTHAAHHETDREIIHESAP